MTCCQADGRVENIYRGSTRLGPLYMELQQQKLRKDSQAQGGANTLLRRHYFQRDRAFIEYQKDVSEPEDTGIPPSGQEVRKSIQNSTYTYINLKNLNLQKGAVVRT